MTLQCEKVIGREEAHQLALSILAITWAFAFLPPFDKELRGVLGQGLLGLGRRLDLTHKSAPAKRPSMRDRRKIEIAKGELLLPEVLIDRPGMLVIHKPPGWEVDSVANETDAVCLSTFLQQRFSRE